jgi:predicted metal-dependent phosphoesterase TrpH
MRLDLHNHILPAGESRLAAKWKKLAPHNCREIYLQMMKYHHLDGLAITNSHDIEMAIRMAEEYPQKIVVGAEYQVIADAGTTVQIVVLNLDHATHTRLLDARLRGIAHFTTLLREKSLPYFWAHIGWGISEGHPRACEIVENLLPYFMALETVTPHAGAANRFAGAIACYYGLTGIGGSDYLAGTSGRRAYTEAVDVHSVTDFFAAFCAQKVEAALTESPKKIPKTMSWEKNVYLRELQKIWHSEFGWSREAVKSLGQNLLAPLLERLPHTYYWQQRQSYDNKVGRLHQRFMHYLMAKETSQIFALDISDDEKKVVWQQKISKIYQCFA